MSFDEDRRNNGSRANNLTVRYIDTRPRERDVERNIERDRYERSRLERDDRQKRYETTEAERSSDQSCPLLGTTMTWTGRETGVRSRTAKYPTTKTPNGKSGSSFCSEELISLSNFSF